MPTIRASGVALRSHLPGDAWEDVGGWIPGSAPRSTLALPEKDTDSHFRWRGTTIVEAEQKS